MKQKNPTKTRLKQINIVLFLKRNKIESYHVPLLGFFLSHSDEGPSHFPQLKQNKNWTDKNKHLNYGIYSKSSPLALDNNTILSRIELNKRRI